MINTKPKTTRYVLGFFKYKWKV